MDLCMEKLKNENLLTLDKTQVLFHIREQSERLLVNAIDYIEHYEMEGKFPLGEVKP
ncbi:MAG: hypothetical protein ACMUEM_04025 [Flavobacteriales bacterium AspAUS03]